MDKRSKILGNEITEVRTDRKTVINGEDDLFVGKNQIINIAANLNHNVGGTMDETVTGKVSCSYNASFSTAVKDELIFICESTIDIGAMDDMNIGTEKDCYIGAEGTMDLFSQEDMELMTNANYTNTVASTAKHTVGSTYTITAGGTYRVTAPMILLN